MVFRRAEVRLAHAVYGLLLTVATLGELIHFEADVAEAVAWLLGGGLVLLAAHVFSTGLAHMASVREDPRFADVERIGVEELWVAAGAVGAAALMVASAVVGLDTQRALVVCIVLGLASLAALSIYASVGHRWWQRVLMAVAAVALGFIIVALENAI